MRSTALDVRCGMTRRVTRRARATWTTPSARSVASSVMISAPRSVASSRYSRMRRAGSDAVAALAGVSTYRARSGARRTAAVAAARRSARGVAGDVSIRTRTRSLTVPFVAVPLPSSCASTRPATNRSASSRRAVRFDSVKKRSSAILARSSRVDVAVAHPLAKRVRAHVDELDLVGSGQHLVGDPLVDRRAGDRRDRVGDRVEVLDVAGADDVDPGVEDDVDVLPALGPLRARGVRVGQLVDQGDRRMPGEDRVGVHLLDDDAAVLDPTTRHDLQPVEQLGRLGPAVGLHEPDDEVRAAPGPTVALLEHPVGLADARRHAEVDPKSPAVMPAIARPDPGEHLVGRRTAVVVALRVAHASCLIEPEGRPGRGSASAR